MNAFDAYVMVDWSANASPKVGKDSIWWCAAIRRDAGIVQEGPFNVATRREAVDLVTAFLLRCVEAGLSVLVGFDFPYGYPAGFASSLQLSGPAWLGTWQLLAKRIEDHQSTSRTNNRFEVAAEFNRILGGGLFWGCPTQVGGAHLTATKHSVRPSGLAEFRLTERRIRGPKSVWQLFYNGSVGSQALLGIPYLHALRHAPGLREVSQVWPFETGPLLPKRNAEQPRIVHAEIYPSFINAQVLANEVRDAAQVRTLALEFAARDQRGVLADDFEAPARLEAAQRQRVIDEEGWILGVA